MQQNKNDQDLTIIISTPQGDWENTFPKTTKVQEVINAVVQHFKFSQKGDYKLFLESDPNNALQPERPLVSYGIKDGDKLIFVDFGKAV